ncbi:MAG TPA: hypothetical protein VMQ76_02720, partial [Terracidiphilus sp.]|nr:hypothetical protein [Terracidiphilus sp.]
MPRFSTDDPVVEENQPRFGQNDPVIETPAPAVRQPGDSIGPRWRVGVGGKPFLTPEAVGAAPPVQTIGKQLGQGWTDINTPLVPLGRDTTEQETAGMGPVLKSAIGAGEASKHFTESLTSPLSIATLGAGGALMKAYPIFSRVLAGVFGATMAKQAADEAGDLAGIPKEQRDAKTVAKHLTSIALTGGTAGLAAYEAGLRKNPVVQSEDAIKGLRVGTTPTESGSITLKVRGKKEGEFIGTPPDVAASRGIDLTETTKPKSPGDVERAQYEEQLAAERGARYAAIPAKRAQYAAQLAAERAQRQSEINKRAAERAAERAQRQAEIAARAKARAARIAAASPKPAPMPAAPFTPPPATDLLAQPQPEIGNVSRIRAVADPDLEKPIGTVSVEVNPEKVTTPDAPVTKPEGEPNASSQPSATSTTQPEVRPQVGQKAPLRQQGETPGAQGEVQDQPLEAQVVAPPPPPVEDQAALRKELAESQESAAPGERIDEKTGLPMNLDGTVTLYHGTTKDGAAKIQNGKTLISAGEPHVYLSTSKEGTGYGDGTVVSVNVDPSKLELDDEFPNGRKDFRIATGKPGGSVKVDVAAPGAKPSAEAQSIQNEIIGMGGALHNLKGESLGSQEAQLMAALDALRRTPGFQDPADRIKAADRIAQTIAAGKGWFTDWALRIKAGSEQYKRLLFGAPTEEGPFWSPKKDWVAARQINSGVAREMIQKAKRDYPSQLTRQGMGKFAEALMFDDPAATLAKWASEARPQFKAQYVAALKLTP